MVHGLLQLKFLLSLVVPIIVLLTKQAQCGIPGFGWE
jgi:hypothetical protein